jgi:putative ABC transport system ATP-binding protein
VVVAAENVSRTYHLEGTPIEAVRDVSLTVRPGEFLAVTGPSGSGKSTLLHLLGAVDTPGRGRVLLDGIDPSTLGEGRRARLRLLHVGLVFQRFHLLPMLTALENVELPMAEAGTGRAEREERAAALLERVGLGDRLRHRPPQLSGGQRQRVAIARALANRPSLLLADEPTGELDRTTSRGILALFQELVAADVALVVATHDLELAAGAGRRLGLRDGRLEGP